MITSVEKWNRAIINIENLQNTSSLILRAERKMRKHEITPDEFNKIRNEIIQNSRRATGTVIFVEYKGCYYLITARHVIEDFNADESENSISDKLLLIENGSDLLAGKPLKSPVESESVLLMNLKCGTPAIYPYRFTSREDDLAVISLSPEFHQGTDDFAPILLKRGYQPITIDDIDTSGKLEENQEITCFGFPGDLYKVADKNLPASQKDWESDILSIPVISRGSVSDPMPNKNYFSGGIFVTHGNSGGPIVSHNKLVGIVLRTEPTLQEIKTPTLNYYISRELYFGKIHQHIQMIKNLDEQANWLAKDRKYWAEQFRKH